MANIIKNLISSVSGKANEVGHGAWEDADSGWVDAKPYVTYYDNGIFIGHDGSIWKYYLPPTDVAIEWLKDPTDAIRNQKFFLDVCEKLGEMLDSQTEKLRNDLRRPFHIQITQSDFKGIKIKPGTPPKHADYIQRMTNEIGSKPVWTGFVGFQLLPGSIFYEAYSTTAKMQRYWNFLKDPKNIEWQVYKEDIDMLDALMVANGFDEPDFIENPEQFNQLTAWHGISDDNYGLSQELQSTRMQQMTHGLSLITPRWGEITFHAIKPKDVSDLVDPRSKDSQWAASLYRPGSDVVVINIRGQIRAQSVSDNLLDLKNIKKQDGGNNDHKDQHIVDLIAIAKNVVEEIKLPMLDNIEIVVGSQLSHEPGKKLPVVNMMKAFGLQAAPLVGRQHLGLLTTFPTYPRHIARIPRGNKKRPELVNVMMPGVLAMSGIFRNTGGADDDGVIVGLSDDGQFEEVYMDPGAANRKGGVPGMLITGRPGAGKTQQLLQMTSQLAYRNIPVFFFNPKKVDTLKDAFDLIDGLTISMESAYLERNPGLLDGFNFLTDRKEIARVITDCLFTGMNAYGDSGSGANKWMTKIQREIQERAVDPRNQCTGDIIFGNKVAGTKPLTDESVVEFVKDKMQVSSFWRAFVSVNPNASTSLKKQMESGRPVLIEWGKSMTLPDAGIDPKDYTGPQTDSVLSVNVTFMYATAITGSSNRGGSIIVDESWVLKSSREALKIIETGGREWRQADITLILATQKITDWMSDDSVNMSTYFSRYLIMSIMQNDKNELNAFFKLTNLPRNGFNEEYILNAARSVADKDSKRGNRRGYNPIPKGYYIDYLSGFESGLICGPWPERELNAGRSDKAATKARRAGAAAAEMAEDTEIEFDDLRGFSGKLAEIATESRIDVFDEEVDLEADAELPDEVPVDHI